MRTVLFHAASKGFPIDWSDFLRETRDLDVPAEADQLADNVWLLPLPECESFWETLKGVAARKPSSIAARSLEVDHGAPWLQHQ
jgi:hypothetical protein